MRAILALLVSAATACAVNLAWDWNTEDYLGGYRIYWGTVQGKPDHIFDVGKVNAAVLQDGGFTPGYKVYFVVKAYNTENKEGLPSNEVSVLIPSPPSDLRFKSVWAPKAPAGYAIWGWRLGGQYVKGGTVVEAVYSKQ